VGATVVIADRATVVDPRQLRRRLENDGITFMQATPATWRLLLEAGWSGHDRLKMLCGGEAMSGALADRLLVGGGELWNMYGPTETTVWSSLQLIARGYDLITIGKPIDRTQLYVLDPERKLVETGAIGELHIGGVGLARGYRGRAELTAERFIANPQGPAGDLIYRTGDLARMLPDGRFECLGRIDHQVKIRGYRIELGEIESVLRQVAGVKEVLVVAEEQ
jgi:non-ribosomal peptide synthetase component F